MREETNPANQITSSERPLSPQGGVRGRSELFFGLVVVAAVWAIFVWLVHSQWAINPEYKYGWSVPFLAGYLLWLRLSGRDATREAPSRGVLLWLGIGLSVLLLVPLRIIQVAHPDWRLISWIVFGQTTVLSLGVLALLGGKRWLALGAVPTLFLATAVPWPQSIEHVLTHGLMQGDVRVVVEVLALLGIPSVQNGNVIELSTGLVGVEEACSGIRSLQISIMLSFFFGELWLLTWPRRFLLGGCAILLAFFCNLIRTAVLSVVGATRGIAAAQSWHDPTGTLILVACFCGITFLAHLMRSGAGKRLRPLLPLRFSWPPPWPAPYLVGGLAALGVWVGLVHLSGIWWYGERSSTANTDPSWTIHLPTTLASFRSSEVPAYAARILSFDESAAGEWTNADGSHWEMVLLRWRPSHAAAQAVLDHNPKVCMTSSGCKLVNDLGFRQVQIQGQTLSFHGYSFEDRGQPLWVFRCISNDLFDTASLANQGGVDWSRKSRLAAVMSRKRQQKDQQMLQAGVRGFTKQQDAEAAFDRQLQAIVQAK